MSSNRGSSSRKRPQKYQNKSAFKNDLHDTSHKTKAMNSLEVNGVCKRCKDIIEWKIKYKKYKPLTAPRKCVGCEEKAIKHAYHLLCGKCASEKQVCAKCCKSVEEQVAEEEQTSPDVQILLKGLPERKRRTIIRFINKKQCSQQKIDTTVIESMIKEMEKTSLDDDFLSDDDGFGDDDDDDEK